MKLTSKKFNIGIEDVSYVGAISSAEVSKLPKDVIEFKDYYWTSEHSQKWVGGNSYATAVSPEGKLVKLCVDKECEVRPILDIAAIPKFSNINAGDIVNCFGHDWYCINPFSRSCITLFCVDSIGRCKFSKYTASDIIYDRSDLAKFIEDWSESAANDEHFEAKIYKGKHLIDTLYSNDFKEITDWIDEEIEQGHTVEFTNKLNGKSMTLTS